MSTYSYDRQKTAANSHAKRGVENSLHILQATFAASYKGVNDALEAGDFHEANPKVSEELSKRLGAMESELHKLTFLAGKL